jgi:hypothetical protein
MPDQDDGVALAEIRPQPRQVVDRDVQMADARRDVPRGRTCHGKNAYVLDPIRDERDALGQRTGKRRLHDQPGWGLVIDGDDRALGQGTGCDRGVFGERVGWLVHDTLSILRFDTKWVTCAWRVTHPAICGTTWNYRSDLNPARRSSTIACGCSHAAKCAPFGWRLK